jgi:hypothetical protein
MGVSVNADSCAAFCLAVGIWIGRGLPHGALGDPKSTVIFALTMPMVITYAIVRIYYWRQDARRAEPMQEHIQSSENMK